MNYTRNKKRPIKAVTRKIYGSGKKSKKSNKHTSIKHTAESIYAPSVGNLKKTEVKCFSEKLQLYRINVYNLINNLQIETSESESEITTFIQSNQEFINTLIPVGRDSYKPLLQKNFAYNFVPFLSICIYNINNNQLLEYIIHTYLQNKGNINLKSIKENITALKSAIDSKKKNISIYLLDHDADDCLLNSIEKAKLTDFLTKKELRTLVKEHKIQERETQLMASEETQMRSYYKKFAENEYIEFLKNGYPNERVSDFWTHNLFTQSELTELKNKINKMMMDDYNNSTNNLCTINKTMFPVYHFSEEKCGMISDTFYGETIFKKYKNILCAGFLLLGYISHKMRDYDHYIVFKGGKAIQIASSGLSSNEYESNDIDILILPKENIEYNEEKVKLIASHVSLLLQWFLRIQYNYDISLLEPKIENPHIYKLSFKLDSGKFIQFCDIDFKQTTSFFSSLIKTPFMINELNNDVSNKVNTLFISPDINSIMDEKLFHYGNYYDLLSTETHAKNKKEYERMLTKFKKSIVYLTQASPDTNKENIRSRLTKLNTEWKEPQNKIIESLQASFVKKTQK